MGLGFIIAIVLSATGIGSVSAQPTSTIAGVAPYLLGTSLTTVLSIDPALVPIAEAAWSNDLPSQNYGRLMQAPLAGRNHPARLRLQFWQGRLLAIGIHWDNSWGGPEGWFNSAAALRQQLTDHYPGLITRNSTTWNGRKDTKMVATLTMDLKDGSGNEIHAFADSILWEIAVVYVSSEFERTRQPPPNRSSRTNPHLERKTRHRRQVITGVGPGS